jgi:hypothetical protein
MSVAIENLNTSREINNVEIVVPVDGGCPGFNEIAWLDAMMAPDNLRLAASASATSEYQPEER